MPSLTPDSPPVSRRRRLTGIVGALAMLAGLAGVASPAYAAESETGSIAGVVTGEAAAPLEGVRVQLFRCDEDFDPLEQRDCWTLLLDPGTEVATAADGTF